MTSHQKPGPAVPARAFGRAVVLGGGIAGLLAARVLADHATEVVVVDRDDLSGDLAGPRRGTSQARHTHGLLVGGLEALERLLPGYTAALVERGACPADLLADGVWRIGGGALAQEPMGRAGVLASRPLVEGQVRRAVAALGVRLMGGYDVVGPAWSADRGTVTGVRLADRSGVGVEQVLHADLVVDATGRASRAPAWMVEAGHEPPPEEVVEIGISYVTRLFRREPGQLGGRSVAVVAATAPERRSAAALAQEGDLWTVTMAGCLGETPPEDLPGFAAYAATLGIPELGELVATARPVGEGHRFRYPASRRVRWDRYRALPEGFVPVGDAVGSFNPVFGQGMTSAALQAEALGRVLARHAGRLDPLTGLAREAARALGAVVAIPWALTVGSDRRYPGMPRKPLPERVLDRYLDRLLVVARTDAQVARAFAEVLNLLAGPPRLLRPAVLARVLRPGAARVDAPQPRAAVAPLRDARGRGRRAVR